MVPEEWSYNSSSASNHQGTRIETEERESRENNSESGITRFNPGMLEENTDHQPDPHEMIIIHCHREAKRLRATEHKGNLPRNMLECIYRNLTHTGSLGLFPRFHPYPPIFMSMLDASKMLVFWSKHFAILSVRTKKLIVIKYLPDLVVMNIGSCVRFKNILIWTSIELTSKDLYFADIFTGRYTLYFRNFTLNPQVRVRGGRLFFSTDDNVFAVRLETINRSLSPRPARQASPAGRTLQRAPSFGAKEKFLVSSLLNFGGGGVRDILVVDSPDRCEASVALVCPAVLVARVGFPEGLEVVCAPLGNQGVGEQGDSTHDTLGIDKGLLQAFVCGRLSACYLALKLHTVGQKIWITFASFFSLNMIVLLSKNCSEVACVEWRSQPEYGDGFIEEIRTLSRPESSTKHPEIGPNFFLAINRSGEVVFLANNHSKLYLISTLRPSYLFNLQMQHNSRLFCSSRSNSLFTIYQRHIGLITTRLSWELDFPGNVVQASKGPEPMDEEFL